MANVFMLCEQSDIGQTIEGNLNCASAPVIFTESDLTDFVQNQIAVTGEPSAGSIEDLTTAFTDINTLDPSAVAQISGILVAFLITGYATGLVTRMLRRV